MDYPSASYFNLKLLSTFDSKMILLCVFKKRERLRSRFLASCWAVTQFCSRKETDDSVFPSPSSRVVVFERDGAMIFLSHHGFFVSFAVSLNWSTLPHEEKDNFFINHAVVLF